MAEKGGMGPAVSKPIQNNYELSQNILSLPLEIIDNIIRFIPPEQWLNVSSTNRFLRDAIIRYVQRKLDLNLQNTRYVIRNIMTLTTWSKLYNPDEQDDENAQLNLSSREFIIQHVQYTFHFERENAINILTSIHEFDGHYVFSRDVILQLITLSSNIPLLEYICHKGMCRPCDNDTPYESYIDMALQNYSNDYVLKLLINTYQRNNDNAFQITRDFIYTAVINIEERHVENFICLLDSIVPDHAWNRVHLNAFSHNVFGEMTAHGSVELIVYFLDKIIPRLNDEDDPDQIIFKVAIYSILQYNIPLLCALYDHFKLYMDDMEFGFSFTLENRLDCNSCEQMGIERLMFYLNHMKVDGMYSPLLLNKICAYCLIEGDFVLAERLYALCNNPDMCIFKFICNVTQYDNVEDFFESLGNIIVSIIQNRFGTSAFMQSFYDYIIMHHFNKIQFTEKEKLIYARLLVLLRESGYTPDDHIVKDFFMQSDDIKEVYSRAGFT